MSGRPERAAGAPAEPRAGFGPLWHHRARPWQPWNRRLRLRVYPGWSRHSRSCPAGSRCPPTVPSGPAGGGAASQQLQAPAALSGEFCAFTAPLGLAPGLAGLELAPLDFFRSRSDLFWSGVRHLPMPWDLPMSCCHLLLSLVSAPSPVQPDLGHSQGWDSHSCSEQPVPGPQHPQGGEFLPHS